MLQEYKMKMNLFMLRGAGKTIVAFWILFVVCATANSEERSAASLDWKVGPTTIKVGHVASQKIGIGYISLEAVDTRRFLEMTENLASKSDVGIIAPEDLSWFASYSYDSIGYVKDDEKGSLNSEVLLREFKRNSERSNTERRRRGLPELILVGWACEPHYDDKTHNLEWAVRYSSKDGPVVNYNTRILGRGGVMRVTLVCDPEELSSVLPEFKSALQGFSYNEGSRYAEYRNGDRIAEVGLSALVIGGATAAAVKTGAFKWLWKVIVVGAAAIGGFFKKIFGKSDRGQ